LAMDAGTVTEWVPGLETVEPAFGLPALWIQDTYREQAELSGYTVVDPVSVLATHLTEVIKTHAFEILGRQETQALVDSLRQSHMSLVDEVVPSLISIGDVQKVLANLLRERISIRNLVTILETLADYAPYTKDTEILSEYVRHALTRQISRQYVPPSNILTCITVAPQLESVITSSVQRTDQGSYVSLDPNSVQAITTSLSNELPKITNMGFQPIVLTSPNVRPYFKKLTERSIPDLIVLSYAELEPKVEVQALGMVKI